MPSGPRSRVLQVSVHVENPEKANGIAPFEPVIHGDEGLVADHLNGFAAVREGRGVQVVQFVQRVLVAHFQVVWQAAHFAAGDHQRIVPHGQAADAGHLRLIEQRVRVGIVLQQSGISPHIDRMTVHHNGIAETRIGDGGHRAVCPRGGVVAAKGDGHILRLGVEIVVTLVQDEHRMGVQLGVREKRGGQRRGQEE